MTLSNERQEELLDRITEVEGFDDWQELLEHYGIDSVVPGACSNEGCTYVGSECEPDAEDYWCEECDTPSVVSCMVLGGII
jgi:hypothetical protein